MTDKKISELDAITGSNTAATDVFVVVDTSTGQTKKITREELNNAIERDVLDSIDIDTINGDFTVNGNINLGDDNKAIFGAGSDLQIYHDGSDSYVKDAGTGYLNLLGTGRVVVGHPSNGHVYLNANYGGDVELFFNNNKKLETTSTGIDVTGTVTADGLTVDGTYTDVKFKTNQGRLDLWLTDTDTTDGQVRLRGDANNLVFITNTTERMRIDSGGNVGIGTGVPNALLDVELGTTGTIAEFRGADSDIFQIKSESDLIAFDTRNTTNGLAFQMQGTERLRITSAGLVGIGTDSPSSKLHVSDANTAIVKASVAAGGTGVASFRASHGTNEFGFYVAGTNALVFYDYGSNAERMRLNSSGNLLVATTNNSPVGNNVAGIALLNNGSGQFSRDGGTVLLANRKTSDGEIARFSKDGTTVGSIGVTGGDNLYIAGNSAHAGGLAIGTSSIYPVTSTGASDDGTNDLGNTGAYFRRLYISGGIWSPDTSLPLYIDGSEKARLDSSGNLLVGRTSTSTSVAGVTIPASGAIQATANFNPLGLNRLSGDGNIAVFQKSGTTVGSIGVDYGSRLYIGTGDTGLFFNDSSDAVQAISTTGDLRGNAIDLGTAGTTFKDLYLGGGVYIGGTGAANKLDDYEEGTFTPVLEGVSGWSGSSGVTGKYTKIGNTVHIFIAMTSNVALTGTATNRITGLPFSNDTFERSSNVSISRMYGINLTTTDYIAGVAGTELFFSYVNGDNNVNNFTSGGSTLRLTVSATYLTA